MACGQGAWGTACKGHVRQGAWHTGCRGDATQGAGGMPRRGHGMPGAGGTAHSREGDTDHLGYGMGGLHAFIHVWQAWIILHNKEFLRIGSFLSVFGEAFFVDALEWMQGQHGFRAPEVPKQVRDWKSDIKRLQSEYEDHFHDLISNEEYGLGQEMTKQWVDNFADQLLQWIEVKMGAWNKLPLCLGELLIARHKKVTAERIVRQAPKDDEEVHKLVPPAVWKAITSLAKLERGNKLENYMIPTTEGGSVTLQLYLSLVYWCICIHNVDSESAFSIIGHKLKIAPNTRLEGLSVHLMNTKNARVVTAAVFEARYKDAKTDAITSYATKPQFKGT